tara:strand:+ start:313 stop:594 length:282 start_codon:yes stop_codon:yes gene_type:complete
MKRLDLICSERELASVIQVLDDANAPGYSIAKHVTGKGPNSSVSEDMELTGFGSNTHVIVFCEQEIIDKIRGKIQPILNYYGGVAYISEANSL